MHFTGQSGSASLSLSDPGQMSLSRGGGCLPWPFQPKSPSPYHLITLSFSPLALIILNVFCFLFTQIPIEGLNLYIHCPTPTPYLPLRRYNLNTYIPDLLWRHTSFIGLRRGSWIGPLAWSADPVKQPPPPTLSLSVVMRQTALAAPSLPL